MMNIILGNFFRRSRLDNARIIDQDIDFSVFFPDFLDQSLPRFVISDVMFHCQNLDSRILHSFAQLLKLFASNICQH